MRLDCISTKEGTFVNEIEAINPGGVFMEV